MSAAQSEETLPILLFYGYFTQIVFLDQLLFDFDAFAGIDFYMTLCNSPGLQRVHISAKQIFHAPLHPSNKKFLSSRFWETCDQRSPGSFPRLSLRPLEAGAGEEPGYEVVAFPSPYCVLLGFGQIKKSVLSTTGVDIKVPQSTHRGGHVHLGGWIVGL